MAEQKLLIKVGDYDVLSELAHDAVRGLYVVTSTCGDHTQSNGISILNCVTYTKEQLEYDLEQFRHNMAAAIAGKAHVTKLLPDAIQPVGEAIPISDGPKLPKPGSGPV
jgi:hypothetical protein